MFVRISKLLALVAACGAAMCASAQDTDENLQRHKNFRADQLTTLVEQEKWYRDIRSASWIGHGLSEEALLRVLKEIVAASGDAEIYDRDHAAWIEAWESAARAAQKAAEAAPDAATARALYTEAYLAYMIASYPHNDAALTTRMLEASVVNYIKAGTRSRDDRVQRIVISGDGFESTALLHMPAGDGPFPVIMWSGGIDVTLIEHGRMFDEYFEPRGYAMVMFDIPAGGFNQGMLLEPGMTAIMHHAVFRAIENHPQLDANRVGALSSSGGGVSIVNFAVENQKIRAAVSRCGLVHGPITDADKIAMLPQMTLDSWSTRVGADSSDLDDIVAKSAPHSLIDNGLLDGTIRTTVPLLAINTHRDPVATPNDMLATARVSETGQVAFFGRGGHCPRGKAAEQFVVDFLTSYVKAD